MDNIIYEEETVREEVFEGDLILDGHMTPEEQRASIFQRMRDAGLTVEKEEEYTIGYEGAEDNDGLSETQTSHFVVTRTYKKQVPYRLNREQIYEGEWILDGIRMTPEEQRQKILQEARDAGVDVGDEENIEIGYEGVEDDNGISETQKTRYVVYHVTKERLEARTEEEQLTLIRDELISLRDRVKASTNPEEITSLSDKIVELSTRLEKLVEESTRDYTPFTDALASIEEEIHQVQDRIVENMKEYLESYERIQKIMGDQADVFHSSLTPEELDRKIQELAKEKLTEDDDSLAARREIDKQLAELHELVAKRNKIRKDFEAAQALGISALEYRELTDNFRSRKLVNAILEQKGLGDLVKIPAKERTKEQKARIKAVREEIFKEIAAAKKEHEEESVLSLVEALYGISTQVQLKGKQRVLIVKPQALENIKNNVTKFPEKIVNEVQDEPIAYTPGSAPKDMEEVMERRAQEEQIPVEPEKKETTAPEEPVDTPVPEAQEEEADERIPVLEKFTIFMNDGKLYARVPVFERFDIEPIGEEVRVEGTACYEISPDDVVRMEVNSNNDFSPYEIEYRQAEVVKKDVQEQQVEQPQAEQGEQQDKPIEKFTFFVNEGKIYVRVPVFERFDIEPIGEEVRIEGTLCQEIRPTDVTHIVANQNNSYSPYQVEYREAEVVKEQAPVEEEHIEEEKIPVLEKFTFFMHDGKMYARVPVFERFNVEPIGERVRIEGTACYEISENDVQSIVMNANNEVSPYQVEEREAEVVREHTEEPPVVEEQPEIEEEKEPEEWEELFSGELIVGEEDIYDVILRDHGIDIRENDDYRVGYEGVTDNDGLSETQTTQYVVFKKKENVKQEEPQQEVEKPSEMEELFSGELIVGEEDIYDVILRDHGIDIRGDDSYYVGYEGVTDNDGLSETQTTRYVVYRVPQKVKEKEQEEVQERVEEPVEKQEEQKEEQQTSEEQQGKQEEVAQETYENQTADVMGRPIEKFTFFTKDGKIYARVPVFERFDVEPIGPVVRIEGTACQEIHPSDVHAIAENTGNSYSPYDIEYREAEVVMPTEVEQKPEEMQSEEKPEEMQSEEKQSDGPTLEKFTFFTKDGKVYARKPVFERFDVNPMGEEVRIEGTICQEIYPSTAKEIAENANNDYSPYIVEYREVDTINREVPPVVELPKEEQEEPFTESQEETQTAHEVAEETPTAHEVGDVEEVGTKDTPFAEQITLFTNNGKTYARKPVFDRFNIDPVGEEVRIEGTACYEVRPEDVSRIETGANNDYSPYFVQHRAAEVVRPEQRTEVPQEEPQQTPPTQETPVEESKKETSEFVIRPEDESDEYIPGTNFKKPRNRGIHETDEEYIAFLKKYYDTIFGNAPTQEKPVTNEPVKENADSTEVLEKVTIFVEQDKKYYVRKPVFERFDVEPIGKPVRLDGVLGYEISAEDVQAIVANKDNSFSPYIVEYREITLDHEEEKQEVPPTNTEEEQEEVITLYRDLNDENQVYAPEEVLRGFGIEPHSDPTMIEGVPCYKINKDTDQIINSFARMSHEPKMRIEYIDVHLKKDLNTNEIIAKLSEGLEPPETDHCKPSNLQISKDFKEELSSGEYAYNIVHIVPANLRASTDFFRKLVKRLLTSERVKGELDKFFANFESLTDEEIEALVAAYESGELDADNPLITDRLRREKKNELSDMMDDLSETDREEKASSRRR